MILGLLAGGGVASAQVQTTPTTGVTCPSDYTGQTTPCSNTTTPQGTAPPSGPQAGGTSGVSGTSSTGSSGPLAFTGANIFRLLLAAAVLLLVGLVLVAIARERRRIRR